jgi:hypothetical protein
MESHLTLLCYLRCAVWYLISSFIDKFKDWFIILLLKFHVILKSCILYFLHFFIWNFTDFLMHCAFIHWPTYSFSQLFVSCITNFNTLLMLSFFHRFLSKITLEYCYVQRHVHFVCGNFLSSYIFSIFHYYISIYFNLQTNRYLEDWHYFWVAR